MDVSFAATGALMAGAFIIVLFTKLGNPSNPVLSLELTITFMATISYVFFFLIFKGFTKFQPSDIPKLRYVEWAATTPLMLVALCLILSGKNTLSSEFLMKIVALDWLMLLIGYLGEVGYLQRTHACIFGFLPFILMFFLIYNAFPSFNVLLASYVLIWSMYGVTYLFETRAFITNVLDSIAKAGIAIAYCVQ